MSSMGSSDYRVEKGRLLAGGRKTYGDFRAWLRLAGDRARDTGKALEPCQRSLAKMFGVCRETINAWFKRAYAEGLVKAFKRFIRKPDGKRYRIANRYVVAFSVKLRGVFAAAYAKLAGAIAPVAEPYVEKIPQRDCLQLGPILQAPAALAPVEPSAVPQARSFWVCRGCSTQNAWFAPSCRFCRCEKPAYALKCVGKE